MPQHNFRIIIFGYILTYWQFASVASANTEFSKTRDCTEIELEALINQDASRENNLARLSQQFFQSVNTIKHCDREQDNVDATPSTDSDSASSSTDADGASTDTVSEKANSTATDTNNSAKDGSVNSIKATQNINQLDPKLTSQSGGQPAIQGTRPAVTPIASGSLVGTNFDQAIMTEPAPKFDAPSASNMAGTTPQPTEAENNTEAQADATEQDVRLTNGETPDDIPDKDNDSVFEAQIRAAAMAETDPDTKKNLWNEYRRYKGLPEQK